tara:strand:+ start:106 stop:300 length:195 start_codon:yes stop_codon:yes gene_type:complete
MSKPTIQEMREQLVNNEVDYIKELVFKDRHQELFDFIYVNSFSNFKDIDDNDVREIYMDLYEGR